MKHKTLINRALNSQAAVMNIWSNTQKEQELTWVGVGEGEVTDAGFLKRTQRILFVSVKHKHSIKTQKAKTDRRKTMGKPDKIKGHRGQNIICVKQRCFPWINKKNTTSLRHIHYMKSLGLTHLFLWQLGVVRINNLKDKETHKQWTRRAQPRPWETNWQHIRWVFIFYCCCDAF